VIPAGTTYREPVSSLDLAATAAAVAGVASDEKLDGVNLIPYLTGEKSGAPHEALFWRFWNQAAVRAGKWKYLTLGSGAEFLFDLESDENERKNLLAEQPDIARRLAEKLTAWTTQLRPPGRPDAPLTRQESRWYEHYLNLPPGPLSEKKRRP
jgi:arylsulfatase A-like enzyme